MPRLLQVSVFVKFGDMLCRVSPCSFALGSLYSFANKVVKDGAGELKTVLETKVTEKTPRSRSI